jgi:hypothetical protein
MHVILWFLNKLPVHRREKAVRNRLGVVRRQLNEKRMVIHSLSGWPEESDEFSKGKGQLHKYSELFGMNLAKEVTVYLRDVLDDIETFVRHLMLRPEVLANTEVVACNAYRLQHARGGRYLCGGLDQRRRDLLK